MKKHHKFSPNERDLLAQYLASGLTKSECSRRLNRPRRSIIREINLNGSWVINKDCQRVFVYIAISAQAKTESRKQHSAHNKQPLKNPDIYTYVTQHLREGLSPEQISGRLREIEHKDDPHWQIRFETIYAWIYAQPKTETGLYWYEYLRRKQKKRKKLKGRYVHRSHIPDRVSISQRPEKVNQRSEFGHWEGDSIEGRRNTKGNLHTEVERMSRRIKATKVKALTSHLAFRAQCRLFGTEPKIAVKSTTLDNGRETHEHYKLRAKFNMATYLPILIVQGKEEQMNMAIGTFGITILKALILAK